MKFNTDIECNENGTNANIKFHILDDKIMREEGFNNYGSKYSFYKAIPILSDLEAYITYDTEDENSLSIMVLDSNFGQPYDYQYFIGLALKKKKKPRKEHIEIKDFMENLILHLQDVGIISGYVKGDII